jgi:hypothetical protein
MFSTDTADRGQTFAYVFKIYLVLCITLSIIFSNLKSFGVGIDTLFYVSLEPTTPLCTLSSLSSSDDDSPIHIGSLTSVSIPSPV